MSQEQPSSEDSTKINEASSSLERHARVSADVARIKSLLKNVIREEEETLKKVAQAYESVNNAAQILIGNIMAITNLFMKESGVSKELKDEIDNLSRNFIVYNQVLKSLNISTETALKNTIKHIQQISQEISLTNKRKEAYKEYEKVLGEAGKALRGLSQAVEGAIDIMYMFARQELAIYDAQIRELQAQRTLAQARTMYNIIIARYGENSEQARRAAIALHYVELQHKVTLQDITRAQWDYILAWAETPLKIAMGILQFLIAIETLKTLTVVARGASVALSGVGASSAAVSAAGAGLGSTLGKVGAVSSGLAGAIGAIIPLLAIITSSFFLVGLAAERVYGGYEGLIEHNRRLVQSFDGLTKDVALTIHNFMVWASTLPTGLREIALGMGVVAEGIVLISDKIGKALSPLFDLFDGLKNYVINSFEAIINWIANNTNEYEKNIENIVKSSEKVRSAISEINKSLGTVPLTESETYQLPPRKQVGGEITREGLYYLHPGEIVTRRAMEGNRITNVSPTITLNLTFNVSGEVDLIRVREEVQRAVTDAIQKGLYNRGVFYSIG